MSSTVGAGDEQPDEEPQVPEDSQMPEEPEMHRPASAPGGPGSASRPTAAERFREAARARADEQEWNLRLATHQHLEHLEALLNSTTITRLLRYDGFTRMLLTAAGRRTRAFQADGCPPRLELDDADAATALLAETEVATAIAGWTDLTVHQVERELDQALTLQAHLPRLLRAAWDRRLHEQHLDVVLRATTGLGADQLTRLDEFAAGLTNTALPSFRRRVRVEAARLRQETQPDVAKTIAEQRTVAVQSCPDGSASLWVNGPAPEIHALYTRLNACARQIRRGPGDDDTTAGTANTAGTEPLDPRTLAQLRFDLLADAIVDGRNPDHLPAQARVAVTVPLLTAIGAADLPGELDGFGPVDAATARDLAGRVPTWTRLLTDPIDGQILPASQQYRIPAALRDHVRRRNRLCTAPGCTKRATDCETDHIIPFDQQEPENGGPTEIANLHPLCTHHHQAKTEGRLGVRRTTDHTGQPVLRWTLPGTDRHLDVPDDPDAANAEQVRVLTEHHRRRGSAPESAGSSGPGPPPF